MNPHNQSTKSLNKYRSQSIEQRALRIGKELLVPPRRKQSKNVFTITSNPHNPNKIDPRPEEELQRRIRMLEFELKRKLNEDGLMRNLFRTKQSHELNHIDLYLQLRSLEDKCNELARQGEESKRAAEEWESMLKEQEEEHLSNMQELNACVNQKEQQWMQQKQEIVMEAQKYQLQSEESQFLIEELKKKNSQLLKKSKDLTDQLAIERESKTLQFIKARAELEKEAEQLKQCLEVSNNRLQKATQSYEQCSQERDRLLQELEGLRDRNEKLQLHLNELEAISNQRSDKEEQLRRQENEKYSNYYQQLRQEHERQIQTLASQHLAAIKTEKKQTAETQQLNCSLQEMIKRLEKQVIEYSQQTECLTSNIHTIELQLSSAKAELQKEVDSNAKLAREIKESNFEKQELQQQINKITFQNRDQQKGIEKMQIKLAQTEEQNEKLILKCEELKAAADNSQAYRKLNDRVYNQNYKTLGRLIQINNQIKQHLQQLSPLQEPTDQVAKEINQESLTEVVSSLAQFLSDLLRSSQTLQKDREELKRDRNIEMREISSILEHCRNLLTGEEASSLMSQYILILRERQSLKEEEKKERVETYHQLIECLINLNSQHYYSSDSRPQFIRDSLDSTYLIREFQSKKKEQRYLERQSSGKNIRKKQRIQTEPSQYDLPLRRKLAIEEDEKENVNLNGNKLDNEPIKRQSNPNRYVNEIRERISHKYPSKLKEPKEELRSEVEKKYFRF